MKKILITGMMLMALPFATFAQTGATTTASVSATTTTVAASTTATVSSPGLVPGDFFYFLKPLGEALRLAFTFNPEKKAQLHLEYAQERVAEIDKVLQNPNAKLKDVASAKVNFEDQVSSAASIIKSEKDKGNDVSSLAQELSQTLDTSRVDLKQTLHDYQDNTSKAEAEIRSKIEALTASSTATSTDPNELKGLTQALESITKEKDNAIKAENSVDVNIASDAAVLEDAMGAEKAAQNHIEQALQLKAHLNEASSQFENIASSSDKLMKDAQSAIQRGEFEAAKAMSKAAERGYEAAKEMGNTSETSSSSVNTMINSPMIRVGEPRSTSDQNPQQGERMMGGINAGESSNATTGESNQ